MFVIVAQEVEYDGGPTLPRIYGPYNIMKVAVDRAKQLAQIIADEDGGYNLRVNEGDDAGIASLLICTSSDEHSLEPLYEIHVLPLEKQLGL